MEPALVSVLGELGLEELDYKKNFGSSMLAQAAHSDSADQIRFCSRDYWYSCVLLYPQK